MDVRELPTETGAPPAPAGWGDAGDGGDVPAYHGDHGREAARADQQRVLRLVVDLLVVGACVAFVLWHLQAGLLVKDTTPAGGDMGAHVWGPAYLRDHLLPHGQVAGWTPDWYAGFPAYQFYMVLPSLLIVLLNAGVHGLGGLVPAAIAIALGGVAVLRWHDRRVRIAALVGAGVALACVGLPYGVAFKLVSVSGVVTLPISAYAFGRLSGLRYPTPAVLAVATLPFLFYRGFTIYGGNIPSTLAGEFAFSMSLSLALVYLGVVFKGLETGRYRALGAVLLALTGLCHLIPAFFALGCTAIILMLHFRRSSSPASKWAPLLGGGAVLALGGLALGSPLGKLVALAGLGLVAAGLWLASDSVRWLTPTMLVGGLLSAWWVGPFYLRSTYLNDMGWEKLPYTNADPPQTIWQYLFPTKTPDVDLRWAFALALVGAGISVALWLRPGIFLVLATTAGGVAFVVMPEGRLWNGRLLPFYYLCVILLAGVAVSETSRTIMQLVRDGRPGPAGTGTPILLVTMAVTVLFVGVPLGQLPFTEHLDGANAWPRNFPFQVHASPVSFVPSWARWNYSGYEGKDAYREYHDIVETMRQVGEEKGCGRAFWEYEKELDRYGTPMALMLLPHWTDGCIGSMEGLYFEASATTPYHFIMQDELSTAPSRAQRDMPYDGFDMAKGVRHLQMMGVKYYMATSQNAIDQARQQPDLREIARSGPWVVFEVADSELVTPLENEPAVVEGIDDTQRLWLEEPRDASGRFDGPSVQWFKDATAWGVALASSGPDEWQRVKVGEVPEQRPMPEVEVSNVKTGDEGVGFDVDKVGTPVLVKISYFPNWKASGADGPYRVAPNLMVVVPTDTHVSLTYGRTGVEYLSYTLTLLGIVGLVLLIRRPRMRFSGDEARAAAAVAPGGNGWGDGYGYGDASDAPAWMQGPWAPRTWSEEPEDEQPEGEPPDAEVPAVGSPGTGPPDSGQPGSGPRRIWPPPGET
jgi:hypothetical protein